jgi:glycine/D-amino acid oxidase-like deaminating enzyme
MRQLSQPPQIPHLMTQQKHVIVIGAGILGASIGYHLVRDGARVTLLDAGPRGGLATRYSWAWINASWGNPEPYVRLRMRAMQEWRRLAAEIPEISVKWAGGLLWDLAPEKLPAYVQERAAAGYDIRLVDRAEAATIEPHLAALPDQAAYAPCEGVVEPRETAEALLRAAEARDAIFRPNIAVRRLATTGGRVTGVVTDQGEIKADEVVLAAGAATAELAAGAGVTVPMSAPAGLLVLTRPSPKILNGLVMAPELHVRQRPDGSLIAGTDFGGADPGTEPQKVADTIMRAMRALLKGGEQLVFDRYTVGHRPLPADEFPAIGSAPGADHLYIAVTHSGITLAPAIGQFVAAEILTGQRDPLLAPYAFARFRK